MISPRQVPAAPNDGLFRHHRSEHALRRSAHALRRSAHALVRVRWNMSQRVIFEPSRITCSRSGRVPLLAGRLIHHRADAQRERRQMDDPAARR